MKNESYQSTRTFFGRRKYDGKLSRVVPWLTFVVGLAGIIGTWSGAFVRHRADQQARLAVHETEIRQLRQEVKRLEDVQALTASKTQVEDLGKAIAETRSDIRQLQNYLLALQQKNKLSEFSVPQEIHPTKEMAKINR